MDEEVIDYQEIFSMLNGANWVQFSEKPKFFFIDVHPIKTEKTGRYHSSKSSDKVKYQILLSQQIIEIGNVYLIGTCIYRRYSHLSIS